MDMIRKRPLFTASCVYLCALSAAYVSGNIICGCLFCVSFAALGVCTGICFIRRHRKERERSRILSLITAFLLLPLTAGFLLGGIAFFVSGGRERALCGDTLPHTVTGTVQSVSTMTGFSSLFVLRVEEADGARYSFDTRVYTEYACDVASGDRITLDAVFTEPAEYENGFAQRRNALAQGIRVLAVSSPREDGTLPFHFLGTEKPDFFRNANGNLRQMLFQMLPQEAAGFVSGILLGNREDVPATISRDFEASGITYILAVSGMHLSALLFGLMLLLRKLTAPPVVRLAATSVGAVLICGISGWSFSVMRAALMLLLVLLSPLVGRKTDGLTSLGFAAGAICLADPCAILDVGLELSFAAMLGILCIEAPIYKKMKLHIPAEFPRTFLTTVLASVSAVLFTCPVQWIAFGEFSVWTVPAGLLCAPLAMAVLYAAPLLLLLFRVPVLGELLSAFVTLFVRLIGRLTSIPGKTGITTVSLRYGFTAFAVLAGVLAAVLLLLFCKKKVWHRLLPFAAMFAVFVLFYVGNRLYHAGETEIAVTTTGTNDIMIIQHDNGILICDFSTGSWSALQSALRSAKEDGHAGGIDSLVLTHCHRRHIASLYRLLSEEYLSTLFLPEPETENDREITGNLAEIAEAAGCTVMMYSANGVDGISSDGITLSVLRTYTKESTHPVLAASVMSDDGGRVLYLGSGTERISLGETTCDVLICGLHGPVSRDGERASAVCGTRLEALNGETLRILIKP